MHTALKILLTTLLLLTAPALMAAKIRHVDEIQQLPENEDEQHLWNIASGHDEILWKGGKLAHSVDGDKN